MNTANKLFKFCSEQLVSKERALIKEFEGSIIYDTRFGPLKLVKNTFLSRKQQNDI